MNKYIRLIISILITLMITACAGTSNVEVPVSGICKVNISLSGGSGKATVESPANMVIDGDSQIVTLTWSSPNYDYMIVDNEKYLPVNTEGNSVFEIPVSVLDEPFTVIADTVAMSKPHEIEYTLTISKVDEAALEPEVDSDNDNQNIDIVNSNDEIDAWIMANLTGKNQMELGYAKKLRIDSYDGGIWVATINDTDKYLIAKDRDEIKSMNIPKGLEVIIANPQNIYVVGSGSMDYFVALDALSVVKYSSIDVGDWDIDKVNEVMEAGEIVYAGKYSAPDFELLRANGCDLIVENTMITHSPEVLLQLKSLDFPVIIDYSIYEESILGRMEWIKLYGLITGRSEEANQAFDEQEQVINELSDKKSENLASIGFFAITSNGSVSVRKRDDNICNIFDLAGGSNGFYDTVQNDGTGQVTIQMEEFYNAAKDCDILIYNSTIAGEVSSKDELLKKCELISKCKAYQEDKIYCTTSGFYQAVMELGDITRDVNKIINDEDDLEYFVKVK